MNALLLTRVHARIALLDLFRSPGYVVPTVVFPALFYALFDLQYARTQSSAAAATTLAFMAFAVSGVCLYQFGVGIASERGRPWERYLRTLPASVPVRFGARIVTALVFAALSAGCVATFSHLTTPIDLDARQWLTAAVFVVAGGVPFVLIGMTIGYWVSARAAVPVATALNLLLAYAGGLWLPPRYLPHAVQQLSPYLPTRQFADLLWSVWTGTGAAHALAGLAIYTAIFATIAATGYRRDERKRYA